MSNKGEKVKRHLHDECKNCGARPFQRCMTRNGRRKDFCTLRVIPPAHRLPQPRQSKLFD